MQHGFRAGLGGADRAVPQSRVARDHDVPVHRDRVAAGRRLPRAVARRTRCDQRDGVLPGSHGTGRQTGRSRRPRPRDRLGGRGGGVRADPDPEVAAGEEASGSAVPQRPLPGSFQAVRGVGPVRRRPAGQAAGLGEGLPRLPRQTPAGEVARADLHGEARRFHRRLGDRVRARAAGRGLRDPRPRRGQLPQGTEPEREDRLALRVRPGGRGERRPARHPADGDRAGRPAAA